MKTIIRAEDIDIVSDRLILGGRVFDGHSILFARFERRVSLELLGYAAIIFACATTAIVLEFSGGTAGVFILACILCLGAYREIRRAHVVVIAIFQQETFEVRGFTYNEVIVVYQAIDTLRGETNSHVGRKSGFL